MLDKKLFFDCRFDFDNNFSCFVKIKNICKNFSILLIFVFNQTIIKK